MKLYNYYFNHYIINIHFITIKGTTFGIYLIKQTTQGMLFSSSLCFIKHFFSFLLDDKLIKFYYNYTIKTKT